MRLLLLGLVIAGCSARAVPEPTVAAAIAPITMVGAAPTLARVLRADHDADALAAIDEQIAGATTFCIEARANDCPTGFACLDGACTATP